MTKIKNSLKKILSPPSPTLNTAAARNLKKVSELMANIPRPFILNLGCGQRFIGQESLKLPEDKVILNLDIQTYSDVNVCGDAHLIPFQDESFHFIISQALLEHTPNPFQVVKEIARVLKKGGYVYIETPFLQGYHADPEDYYRFTLSGLKELLSPFNIIETGVCTGASSALSWLLREYLTRLSTFGSQRRFLKRGFYFLWGWLTFPLKYLDLWMGRKEWSAEIASGYYFLGQKAESRANE